MKNAWKIKWQIPGEPLAARYNWCQGPGTGPRPGGWGTLLLVSDRRNFLIAKIMINICVLLSLTRV